MGNIPKSRPRATNEDIRGRLRELGLDPESELMVYIVRGYYRDSMGKAGVNDRGIYDDAIFLVGPSHFSSYNGNSDPSGYRKGHGTGASKGVARLKPGVYYAHQLGLHKGEYTALVQRAGPVTVIRDGDPDYEETGFFGINIHRGRDGSTSSLGCQTIPPSQWFSFIENVKRILKDGKQKIVPVILMERKD